MDEKLTRIIHLIEISDLDQTIKDILIRDLKAEGLTDFLREQIISYCLEGIKKTTAEIEEAKKILSQQNQSNPS
jgi:uncharacterized protein (DUF2164 family)